MRNKKTVFFGMLIVFGLIFSIIPIKGITRDATISTVAEKDSYVSELNPTSNYGGQDWLKAGFGYTKSNELKSYLYFNFTDKPVDWTKSEIFFDIWSIEQTINLTFCLINESWNEYNITWQNKPQKEEIITNLIVGQSGSYKIDVSEYIEGRNNISICAYVDISNYISDYVIISSREDYSYSDHPKLIWTYSEIAEIAIKSPKENDKWEDFNDYSIRWSSKGSIEKVKIQLFKGNSLVEDITYSYTDNNGEYDFYVWSSKDYYGTDYRIKIADHDDSRVYDYSDYFSINVGGNDPTTTFLGGLILLWIFLPVIIIVGFIAIVIVLIKKRQSKPEQLSRSSFENQPKQASTQRSEQIKEIIAFCPNCGRKLNEGENFCMKCGYEL